MPSKHWSKTTGKKMSEYLYLLVLKCLREVVQSARIISITTNEVIYNDLESMYIQWKIESKFYTCCISHISLSLASLIIHSLMDEDSLFFITAQVILDFLKSSSSLLAWLLCNINPHKTNYTNGASSI